jgi:transposase
LNQLELVHETLRHALNELAVQAPDWLKQQVTADWFDHYSRRTNHYLLPKKEDERQVWAERIGRDGLFLLEQVYRGGHHLDLVKLPAVEILRQVWLQNFYQDNEKVRLRQKKTSHRRQNGSHHLMNLKHGVALNEIRCGLATKFT